MRRQPEVAATLQPRSAGLVLLKAVSRVAHVDKAGRKQRRAMSAGPTSINDGPPVWLPLVFPPPLRTTRAKQHGTP